MEAHVIDIRDQGSMRLLLDGGAMSVWELLRRYGGTMTATAIERVVRYPLAEIERALEQLLAHGLAERHPARGRRRVAEYSSKHDGILVGYRPHDASDRRDLEVWMPRIEVAMAQAAIRLEVLDSGEAIDDPVRRSIRLSTHLEPKEAEELRSRVDDLLAFMRLLESRHAGETALDSFLCNYRVDVELQPLQTPAPASALVVVRPFDGEDQVWNEDGNNGERREASDLSPREREVALGIVNGRSRSDIASRLGITSSTVATLTKRLYRKLGVHSRTQLTQRLVGRHA